MKLSIGLGHLNSMKVVTLNYVDCVPFSCFFPQLFIIEPTNLKKSYSQISENMSEPLVV